MLIAAGCFLGATSCQFVSGLEEYGVEPPPLPPPPIDSVWSKSFGGTGNDGANEVAVDAAGNSIVVGALGSPADFGDGEVQPYGGKDAFVLKLDRDGEHVWSRVYGGTEDDSAIDAAIDADGNVLVVGLFIEQLELGDGSPLQGPPGERSLFVVKLDQDGELVWSQGYVGFALPTIPTITVDGSGNVLFAGGLRGSVDFGGGALASAGTNDVFVVKLDDAGEHVWSRAFPTAMGDDTGMFAPAPSGLEVTDDGAVLIAGSYGASIDILGTQLSNMSGNPHVYAARLNADATGVDWHKEFGATEGTLATTTSRRPGQFLLAGSFAGDLTVEGESHPTSGIGNADLFIARFDEDSGAHEGTTSYGATVFTPAGGSLLLTSIVSMDVNDLGEILIAGALIGELRLGDTTLTALGGTQYDLFAAKLAADGVPLLAARYGDANLDLAVGGALDPFGNVLVTGYFEGQLLLGTDRLVSRGDRDIFVVKLVPDGQ